MKPAHYTDDARKCVNCKNRRLLGTSRSKVIFCYKHDFEPAFGGECEDFEQIKKGGI